MKVLILGGFLGSGKTSVLLQLAKYLVENSETMGKPSVAILENEIGETSIDGTTIQNTGYSVTNLFSGCVCCSMATELIEALDTLQRDLDPEWVIVESTGLAIPSYMQDNIQKTLHLNSGICTIVDAKRWEHLFDALDVLLTKQLKAADVILINKIDRVDSETLECVLSAISTINPEAPQICVCAKDPIDTGVWQAIVERLFCDSSHGLIK
ncbi:MAG: GTP-binding protein [Actinobacteria bacterium]|nr:GTP-binding protein [Actinomycetota bacterium]